jgi:biotin operon repressor
MAERFAKLARAAVFDLELSSDHLRALAVIATCANNGTAHPSIDWIADKLGVSRRQVQRHIQSLRHAGYLSIEPRPGKAQGRWPLTQWRLHYPDQIGDATSDDTLPSGDASSGVASTDHLMRHPMAGDATSDGSRCDTAAPSDATQAMSPKNLDQRTRPENETIEQPSGRAVARGGVTEDLKDRVSVMLAKQEADRKATMQRLAQRNAELAARMQTSSPDEQPAVPAGERQR